MSDKYLGEIPAKIQFFKHGDEIYYEVKTSGLWHDEKLTKEEWESIQKRSDFNDDYKD